MRRGRRRITWETEEDIGGCRWSLNIEKGGNCGLSQEQKEEMQILFHKCKDLLTRSMLNNNNDDDNNNNNNNNNNNWPKTDTGLLKLFFIIIQ